MVPAGTEQIIRVEESTLDADGRVTGAGPPDARVARARRRGGQGRGPAAGRGTGHARPRSGWPRRADTTRCRSSRRPGSPSWSSATNCSPPGRPATAGCATRSDPQVPGWLRRLGAARCPASSRTARSRTRSTRTSPRSRAALERRRRGLHHRRHDARPGRPPASGAGRAGRRVRGRTPSRCGPGSRCCSRGSGRRGRAHAGSSPGCPATRSRPSSRWCRWSSRCCAAWPAGPSRRCRRVTLAEPVARVAATSPTWCWCASTGPAGATRPAGHAGSAMLRGLARADGFAVIAPGTDARGRASPYRWCHCRCSREAGHDRTVRAHHGDPRRVRARGRRGASGRRRGRLLRRRRPRPRRRPRR